MNTNLRTIIVFVIILLSLPVSVYADLCGRQEANDGFVWYRVCGADGKQGAEDAEGHTLIPAEYDEVMYFTTDGGWFSVGKNDKYGVYTRAGKMLCDAVYDGATYNKSNDGIWIEIKKDGGTGVMDESGKVIIWPEPKYSYGLIYQDGSGFSYKDPKYEYSYKCIGKLLTEDNPEDTEKPKPKRIPREGNDGFVWYETIGDKGLSGAEDEEGNVLIPPKYHILLYRQGGYFQGWIRTGLDKPKFKIALHRASGEMIIDAIYDYAIYHTSEDGNWIEVNLDDARGAIDEVGNVIVPLKKNKNKMYKYMGYDTKIGFYYENSRGRKFPIGIFLKKRKDEQGAGEP